MMEFRKFSCLNPKIIRNKYTHEQIIVPCGECEFCQLRKANDLLRRVDDESKLHADIFFVTLSYSDEFVPTLFVSEFDDPEVQPWYDLYVQSGSYREVYSDKILYLSKSDVQLFIKRLRKNISTYVKQSIITGNAGIRYYCIGEYGGTTKRPHYHLLFFFDNRQLALFFEELVRKSWRVNVGSSDKPVYKQIGNIQCERPFSTCSSYVTAYLTTPSSLPAILTFDAWKPFYLASSRPALGSQFFDESIVKSALIDKQLSYQKVTKKFDRVSLPHPRSFKVRYFPKLTNFNSFSNRQLAILYCLTLYFPLDFFQMETNLTFQQYVNAVYSLVGVHHSAVMDTIERYLSKCSSEPINALYSLAQASKKFVANLRFIQKFKPNFKIIDYVSLIKDYYVRLDYSNLRSQLQFEQDYTSVFNRSTKEKYFLASLDPLFPTRKLSDVALLEYSQQFNIDFSLSLKDNPEFVAYSNELKRNFHTRIKSHFDRDYLKAHPEFMAFHSGEF